MAKRAGYAGVFHTAGSHRESLFSQIADMYQSSREKSPKRQGMGGWLAFLVVNLLALWPLGGLVTIYVGFTRIEETFGVAGLSAWEDYKKVTWLFFLASATVSILTGYRLCRVRDKTSVRAAIYGIWLAGPVLNLAALLVGRLVLRVFCAGGSFWQGACSVAFSVAMASLWTGYLKRSVRVKNTYNLPWYP